METNQMQINERVILFNSPEAAIYKTGLEGWVDANGHYCGIGPAGESLARQRSATHKHCGTCGETIKANSFCRPCHEKGKHERYLKLPFKEYDGSPVCLEDATESGDYFFSEDAIVEYMEENELDEIDLLFCREERYHGVGEDYWEELIPEDGELPKAMQEALDNLNKVIRELKKPASYWADDIRTSYKLKANS